MTHELSPAQLEAATHQRRTVEDLIAEVEKHEFDFGTMDDVIEWLWHYRDAVTFDVDAYRAEHPELVPTPADICREAAGRAEAAGYEWSLNAPKNHPYRSPYQLHIYGRADDADESR